MRTRRISSVPFCVASFDLAWYFRKKTFETCDLKSSIEIYVVENNFIKSEGEF